ncbi:ankyrin repeat domain-containing protein 50 [Coprinopsis cinerea AmutBmut pab1-1]|nr:ankyrin repeat domain-containing protein 50 [Coprinopsis cinerea AmutBmut pab1-1]
MKFGKRIQAQQIPGWSQYYLDYKFLKKIISSLAANRPASEAAALALGAPQAPSNTTSASTATPTSPGQPPFFPASDYDAGRGPDFQAHKAAFFFKLERELEKINAFYLQKEAELKLRMETLLSKRRAAAARGMPDTNSDSFQNRVEWSAVEEGFRLLERDLGKLQQFVEINAEGFRKILKKFDKRSTSTTKELYLARQVDVQPVFNRQLISELANTVATCLLDITDLSSGLNFEGPNANDIFTQRILTERTSTSGPFGELESNFHKAIAAGDAEAIKDCVHYSEMLSQQSDSNGNITRILWNIIIEAPPDFADLILASLSSPFDYLFVDDIHGRTCLHEAAIAGAERLVDLCLQNGVPVDKADLYGRTALHYAAIHGHAGVCRQLLQAHVPPNTLDRDNSSPLVYATTKGHVECVRVLLEEGNVPVQQPVSGDANPLSLAARAGHVDVVVILLKHNAACSPNSNGEYPMHLAVQKGHTDVCKLLLHLEGWDTPDKYHEWTPLFHAARHGHEGCVHELLQHGARPLLRDEMGHLAAHYAAWYGHVGCLKLLLEASPEIPETLTFYAASTLSPLPVVTGDATFDSEIDMIPSLSLPPPIMPHRVYGHNYLVNQNLVQVFIGRWSRGSPNTPSVRLHHRLMSPVFKDEYVLATSPLKLVMTTKSKTTTAPYSMTVPPQPGEGFFSFQVHSLEDLTLEFSIYPNFGTKTIGRAVALPAFFAGVENNQTYVLPILDHRLHTIGEVDFQINVIRPFEGVTLEVGGDVETYWKSTEITSVPSRGSGRNRRSNQPGSAHTSPGLAVNPPGPGGQALTQSSLFGTYLHVVVQVTRDLHPVVFSEWLVPGTITEQGVADVTLAQFETLAQAANKNYDVGAGVTTDWPSTLSSCMISLESLLKSLPASFNLALELAYPTQGTVQQLHLGRRLHLNDFVDAVLRTIYGVSTAAGTTQPRRKVAFLSFAPDVCSALNWKQPNYPVFFASQCGKHGISGYSSQLATGSAGDDQRTLSIGSAVEFAKSNNLLGVFIDSDLLIRVPSAVDGIRNSELIVGVLGSAEKFSQLTSADQESHAVDAYFDKGTLTFVDRSLRELL